MLALELVFIFPKLDFVLLLYHKPRSEIGANKSIPKERLVLWSSPCFYDQYRSHLHCTETPRSHRMIKVVEAPYINYLQRLEPSESNDDKTDKAPPSSNSVTKTIVTLCALGTEPAWWSLVLTLNRPVDVQDQKETLFINPGRLRVNKPG